MRKNTLRRLSRGLSVVAMFAAVGVLSGCGSVIKTGNVGLVVNHYTGQVDGRVRHAGFNPLPPASGLEMVEIPAHKRTYTMVQAGGEGAHTGDDSVRVNTSTGNSLNVDVSITYHINTTGDDEDVKLKNLYAKYRSQFQGSGFSTFEENQLRPLFRKAISDAFGKASTIAEMTGDGKIAAAKDAKDALNARLNPDSIIVDEVRIRAIWPDEATKTTLRTHLVAEQNLALASLKQQLAGIINERKVSKANEDAIVAGIRAKALTPRLVRYKHLQDITIIGVPAGAIVNDSGTYPDPQTSASPAPAQADPAPAAP